jgi:hypothetical protein
MNRYETVFILTPVLSDAQAKEAVAKIQADNYRWCDQLKSFTRRLGT